MRKGTDWKVRRIYWRTWNLTKKSTRNASLSNRFWIIDWVNFNLTYMEHERRANMKIGKRMSKKAWSKKKKRSRSLKKISKKMKNIGRTSLLTCKNHCKTQKDRCQMLKRHFLWPLLWLVLLKTDVMTFLRKEKTRNWSIIKRR